MAYIIIEGRFGSADQAIACAMEVVKDAHKLHGEVAHIGTIADGTHMDGSLHYPGPNSAFDFKLAHVPEEKRQPIVDDIQEALRCDKEKYPYSDFDVIYGDEGHKHHGHLEWQPKRAMNR